MKIKINIDDYLSEEEKKQLCIDHVKEILRGDTNHRERILSNMAYSSAFKIIDESLTKEDIQKIKNKIKEIISDPSSYSIFRKKDAWGEDDSEAYIAVKKAVSENKHLINDLVKKAILERDYSKDIYDGEYIVDAILEIFKKGIEK